MRHQCTTCGKSILDVGNVCQPCRDLKEARIESARDLLKILSPKERLQAWKIYCSHCGELTPSCKCWSRIETKPKKKKAAKTEQKIQKAPQAAVPQAQAEKFIETTLAELEHGVEQDPGVEQTQELDTE